jgi:alkaline phosphatase/alkaline phosphatase D
MAGELSETSVILQARLCAGDRVRFGDVAGRSGWGWFEISRDPGFLSPYRSPLLVASPQTDYLLKVRVDALEPGTRYYYRLQSVHGPRGPGAVATTAESNPLAEAPAEALAEALAGPAGTFRTLGGRGSSRPVRLAVVTGLNRFAFRAGFARERKLGFPGLEAIAALEPDFLVATGDNVYYDTPRIGRADDLDSMRAKWHRQFATPRFRRFLLRVPVYWQKDDHDFRYNDADPYGDLKPGADLGMAVFREQVPVVDPRDPTARTYRTYRINDLLQIWLLEGRDYRHPNAMPPGPDKSMWGSAQRAWLERTLSESSAVFKLVVSPTPLIGPDDAYVRVQGGILSSLFGGAPLAQGRERIKRDNHTNRYGFRDEGEDFFAWLSEHGFREKNLYFLCGDRHWQYHSIQPDGFEEFSVGALVGRHSRPGRTAGDPESTDPQGLISQPYLQAERYGGFLEVNVRPGTETGPPSIHFAFRDERGSVRYQAARQDRGARL